jgi:thiol-disulfide isomerase/thioredoxin
MFTIIADDNFSNEINIFFEAFLPMYSERAEKVQSLMAIGARARAALKLLKLDLIFLEEVCQKRLLTNNLKMWAQNWLTYKTAYQISGLPFGRFNEPIGIKTYLKLFGAIPLDNLSAISCSEYLVFLKWLSTAYYMISTKGKGSLSFEAIGNAKEYSDKNHTGLTKELIYVGLQRKIDENYKENSKSPPINLADHIIYKTTLNKYFVPGTVPENDGSIDLLSSITSHIASDSTKNKILTRLNQYRGKYIFIDFWGSWCMPCLVQMPQYNSVIEKLRRAPVSFVFLSVETSEEDMMFVKKTYDINADFYNLDINESHLVMDVFNFNLFPAHFIVTPDRKIFKLPGFSMQTLFDDIKRIVK